MWKRLNSENIKNPHKKHWYESIHIHAQIMRYRREKFKIVYAGYSVCETKHIVNCGCWLDEQKMIQKHNVKKGIHKNNVA